MRFSTSKLWLLVCVFLTGCVFKHYQYSELKPKAPNSIRLASYNLYWRNGTCAINHPKSSTRLLKALNADLILIQEITPKLQKCITEHLASSYPYGDVRFYGNEGGLAIFSKYPYKTDHYIAPKHGIYPAWITTVATPSGSFQLMNLHLHPQVYAGDTIGFMGSALFTTPDIRGREMAYFYEFLNHKQPIIIAGDFNDEEQGPALTYLRKKHFKDTLKYTNTYTWKHQVGPITLAKRFDRIFLSNAFSFKQVQVIHESSSDHYPVIVDFAFRQK